MNSEDESESYQGMFASNPDRVDQGIWDRVETHTEILGPDVQVHKDWYGNVTKVESSWFDW